MGSLPCPLCCGKSFASRQSLKCHLLLLESKISCPECLERFVTISELACHLDNQTCGQIRREMDEQASSAVDYIEPVDQLLVNDDSHSEALEDHTTVSCGFKLTQATNEFESNEVVKLEEQCIKIEEIHISGEFDHFCESCGFNISAVQEHIEEFHLNETVILQTQGDNKEVILHLTEEKDVSDSADLEVVSHVMEEKVVKDNEVKKRPKYPIPKKIKVVEFNLVCKPHVLKLQEKIDSERNSLNKEEVNKIKVVKVKPKVQSKFPQLFSVVEQCDKVDNAGIPYTRNVVQVERFWEKPRILGHMAKPSKKREVSERVPPKFKNPLMVEAHVKQMLNSGSFALLKQSLENSNIEIPASNEEILKRVIDAANNHPDLSVLDSISIDEGRSVSDSTSDLPSEIPHLSTTCDYCGLKCKTLLSLSKHVKCQHQNLETKHFFQRRRTICDKCGLKCKTNKELLIHLKSHGLQLEKEQPYPRKKNIPCKVCGIIFKTSRSLTIHARTHDPNLKTNRLFQRQVRKLLTAPGTCEICKTEFTSVCGLRIHMKIHRPDYEDSLKSKMELCCDICNTVCYTEQGLKVHYKVHFRNQETLLDNANPLTLAELAAPKPILKCKLCNLNFKSNKELGIHWQNHQLEESSSANYTPEMFTVVNEETVTNCESIIPEIHIPESDNESFLCETCGQDIAENLREAHERMHHQESKFTCIVCNKYFPSEVHLAHHSKTHTTAAKSDCALRKLQLKDASQGKVLKKKAKANSDRPYPCGFCYRRFLRPCEKISHERVHTGEKPFQCEQCYKKFRVKGSLRLHERIHTGVRPYSCEQCGKRFRVASAFRHHLRLHSDERKFPCPFCPKTFKTSVSRATHRAIHTKPFSCNDCGRRFPTMSSMRAHMITHSKQTNQHQCYICGATYVRKYALNDHIKAHDDSSGPSDDDDSRSELDDD